jgi:hypothetical protein
MHLGALLTHDTTTLKRDEINYLFYYAHKREMNYEESFRHDK